MKSLPELTEETIRMFDILLRSADQAYARRVSELVEECTQMNEHESYLIRAQQQSRIFMAELFPTIIRLIHNSIHVSILDVGPGTGAGTALLRDLLHPDGFYHVKVPVWAMDIDPTYRDFAVSNFNLNYLVGDISQLPLMSYYDLVLSSHVIEHVPDPYDFLGHLRRISRRWTVVTCPWMEPKDARIPGHVNTIDYEFIHRTNPDEFTISKSAGWGQEVVTMVWHR